MPRKQPKKNLILAAAAVVVLALAGYMYYDGNRGEVTDQTTPEIAEEKTDSKEASGEDKPTSDEPAVTPSTDPEKEPPKPTPSPSFELTLSRDVAQRGSNVEVRAFVSGATSGKCKVTFSKGNSSFSRTSSITFDGRAYSCGAFNVPVSQFGSSGSWNYTLSASSGSKVSNKITGKVAVQK